MQRFTSAAIGTTVEGIARRAVPVVAAVFTAGLAPGLAVHRLNDLLASLAAGRPALPPAPAPVALLPQAVQPVALESLTCRELRELLGIRRKLSKRQLIAMAQRGVA